MKKRRITILGATGSIGCSALDVLRRFRDDFEVVGIAANANVDAVAAQVAEFKPAYAALADEQSARALRDRNLDTQVLSGLAGLEELARVPADMVLCGMVGAVGLKPILAAIEAGNHIALANKEPLVIAGRLIMEQAHANNVEVLPVDSEHNAIFQCLTGHRKDEVHRIYLTASGGPFYNRPRESLRDVTPEEAASHPTWDMGVKISVDSATLMNKGLEIVEAMWLFDLPLERVRAIIHPQSIVHGLVEFTDGSILAHLGPTDMRYPIQFALTWPERVQSSTGRLSLAQLGQLTFAEPDFSEFPCLAFALEAARTGGTAPAALNAANETAVEAFCGHRIGFLQIAEVISEVMSACHASWDTTLEAVLEADAHARALAHEAIETFTTKV